MEEQTEQRFIKTKVILDFDDENQAKAFFDLFNKPIGEGRNGLDLLIDFLPIGTGVTKVENVKELKHNYFVKVA